MPARVVVIALDAYEKDLLLDWARSGELRALAGMLPRATWGVTEGPAGIYGGSVWPSFTTGLSPGRHRRFFRRQARRGEYLDVEFKPTDIEGEPFWDVLSAAGRRLAVLDVPHAALSGRLNGIQLVDWASHDPELEQALAHPATLREEIVSRFGIEPPDLCEHTEHTAEGYRRLSAHLHRRIRNKTEMARHFLAAGDWDLFLAVFGEAHCAGHQWWHLHDPTHPRHAPDLAASAGGLMKATYVALDAAVGEIVAEAGPAARVIIICSHGMGPLYGESVVLDEVLRRLESSAPAAPGSLFAGLKRGWYRLPPAVRGSLPVRALKAGVHRQLHRSLLVPDRQTRRFFAVPYNPHAGAIRINLAGRESHGLVQPGDEYRALCARLREELLALTCPVTGARAVAEVCVAADLFHGPFADEIPDLLVQWNRHAPPHGLSSPRIGTIAIPAMRGRSGDHTREGLFVATGPGLAAGRVPRTVPIVDFAPTFAEMLDVPPSAAFEGRPIGELLGRRAVPTRRDATAGAFDGS